MIKKDSKKINILVFIVVFIILFSGVLLFDKFIGLFVEQEKGYYDFLKNYRDNPFFQIVKHNGILYIDSGSDTMEKRRTYLPLEKTDTTIRIVFTGGSSVYGSHVSGSNIFTSLIEKDLNNRIKNKNIEIINMGGRGFDSDLLLHYVDELLSIKPDIVVIYTGHNDGFHFMYDINDANHKVGYINKFAEVIGFKNNIRKFFLQFFRDRQILQKTKMDYFRSDFKLSDYVKFYLFYKKNVLRHFNQNMELYIKKILNQNIKVILITPVSNISDLPPVVSFHFNPLSLEKLNMFNMYYLKGVSLLRKTVYNEPQLQTALDAFEKCTYIDNSYAELHYNIGKLYSIVGKYNFAYEHFLLGRDNDAVQARAISGIDVMIYNIGKKYHLPVINSTKYFMKTNPKKWIGNNYFVDYMHFNKKGHSLMREMIVPVILNKM